MSSVDKNRDSYKIDLAYAAILGLTVITTAWCGVQHEIWTSMLTFELKDASILHQKYTVSELKDRQATIVDIITFTDYMNAKSAGDKQLAEYYKRNFSPELKKSFDVWTQTGQLADPNTINPFMMSDYSIETEQTRELLRMSEEKSNHASEISVIASQYVFFTVIYAGISFLEGIGRVFPPKNIQKIFLIMGGVLFSVATIILFLTMPIAAIHI